jgi:selenocysteine-specific translation elongation factor
LRLLKPIIQTNKSNKKLFQINEVIYINELGVILIGVVKSHMIEVDDNLLLGYFDKETEYFNVKIQSIHHKQIPVKKLYFGEIGTLRINIQIKNITKHMSLFDESYKKYFKNTFSFYISIKNKNVLNNNLEINHKYLFFCNNCIETITILSYNYSTYVAKFTDERKHMILKSKCIIKKNNLLIYGETNQ